MQRVLVTGGCGFVGVNLIDHIMEREDWEVRVLDNLSVGKREYLEEIENYSEKRIEFQRGDIRNEDDVEEAVSGVYSVIHLAAQTGVIPSVEDPIQDAEINVMGTLNLLKECVEHGIDSFIQASSAAPLGEQEQPIHEGKVPTPLSPYGASKLSCEGYCSAFAGSYELKTVALRFSNVYGPYSWHKGSVVAKFIKQILDGERPVIFGDGGQTRDFIHSRDISRAVVMAVEKEMEEDFELFQLGTGTETSVNMLYSAIKKHLERHDIDVPKPDYSEPRPGEIYRNYADISKARERLGYEPEMGLDEGIEQTIEWFIENH